jgi:hypothetical protein
MALGDAIYNKLSNDAATAAIVGNRIYPGFSSEGIYPLCAYTIKGLVDDAINKGSTQHFSVVVTCLAYSYTQAAALLTAVKAAIDRQVWTAGTTSVSSVLFEDSDESSFTENGNQEVIYYEHEATFSVFSTEIST